MAFGFTPKFQQTYSLSGIAPQHTLVIAVKAAKKLGWDINYTSSSGFIAYIGGGMFASAEEFTLTIGEEEFSVISKNISSGMVDWGKNKRHVNDFISEFGTLQDEYTTEQLDERYHTLSQSFPPPEEDLLQQHPPTAAQNFLGFLSFFTPRKGYFVTPIIINLNIAVFILMVATGVSIINPTTDQLLAWGANFRALTLAGQWWRLLTNVFLHIGVLHLLLNMYALLYIGLLLEPYLGRARFLIAYLCTGILAHRALFLACMVCFWLCLPPM
jgi:rhomboid protease GluP